MNTLLNRRGLFAALALMLVTTTAAAQAVTPKAKPKPDDFKTPKVWGEQ